MQGHATRLVTSTCLAALWLGSVLAGPGVQDGARSSRFRIVPVDVDAPGGMVDPAGASAIVLRPGEIRTFIEHYTIPTAGQVFTILATPELPSFIDFAFNGGTRSGLQFTLQYRLEVDSEAPGGTYPSRIVYTFLDIGNNVLDTRESDFTIEIDAPPAPDDHGDDCETATPVELNSQTGGSLAAGGDTDYFRVTLTEAGTLTAFTTGTTDTVGTLLSSDCTPLQMDDDSGTASNFSISQLLDAGVYHVAVAHANVLGDGDYTLNIQFEPVDPFVYAIHFPQFANGGGLTSQLKLLSLGSASANALISIRGDDGTPLDLALASPAGVGTEGEMGVAVPGDGLAVFQTDGMGDPVAGSVTVRSDQPLAGVLVFGGQFGLAGVQSSPALEQEFIAPVETGGSAQTNTGVALQNLEDSEVSFQAQLLSGSGTLLASSSAFNLPAQGHLAIFVDQFEWDNAIDFASGLQAVLRVASTGGRFAGTVLLVRPGQLASLPVVVQSNP